MKKLLLILTSLATTSTYAQWLNTTNNSAQDCISAYGKVFASDVSANGLDVSVDQGASWASSNTGVPASGLSFGTLSGGSLYAYKNNTVFVSTTGNNWSAMSGAFGATDVIKAMTSVNGTVFATTSPFSGTSFKIFQLNGSNWALTSSTNGTIVASLKNLNGVLFAGTTAHGIIKSTDGGVSFSNSSTGMPTEAVNKYVSSFGATSSALFAGTYGGRICRSTDNGTTWSTVYNIGDGTNYTGINDFYVHSNNEIFAATDSGFVYSLNNGVSWQKNNNGLNFSNFENYMTRVTVDGSYIVASVKTMVAGKIVRMPLNEIVTSLNKNNILNATVAVYPNPTSNKINFEIENTNLNSTYQLTIHNLLGMEIESTIINNGKVLINVASYAKGVYTYAIEQNKQFVKRGKFIVD